MFVKLLMAFAVMAMCVTIHAVGLTAAMRWLRRSKSTSKTFGHWTGLLIAIASGTILIHLIEIALWAVFYTWMDGMPDMHSALYFSAATYTTVGYGDLVLPSEWRLVGGIEALTGILMCGWSTAFFFAVVGRMHQEQTKQE